jgi:CBS domain containing-hemolysin-like protein
LDPGSIISVVVIAFCLLLLACNVGVETALTNVSRLRLHQLLDRGVPRAQALSELLGTPRLHTIIRAANLILIVAMVGAATGLALRFSPDLLTIIGVLALLTLIAIVVSLLAPQAIAVRNPERAALLLIGYVTLLRVVLTPLLNVLYWMARPLARVLDGGREAGHYITEEEMRQLVNTGEDEGVIQADEEVLIQQIFEFGDTVVREVMVPRTDMVAAADDEPLGAVIDSILACGHTRLPVYHENIDNVVGIVNAKDLLLALRQGHPDQPLLELVRPAHFIPETKKVNELLRDLQQHRLQMAIVVDEYGGTSGLVTLEDLVEEIVGEIQDEYDREPVLLEEVSPNEWRCDARLPLDDLNDLLGTDLEGADVETVGGLVQERLGRIPIVGDSITEGDITITVTATEGLRIKQVDVRRGGGPEGPPDIPPPLPSTPSLLPVDSPVRPGE